MDDATLPFKTASEFILNEVFHLLVIASKLPRPNKNLEQSISFCKAFCKDLLNHEVVKSDLVRGLSSFDTAVIYDGMEEHYTSAIDKLTRHFTSIEDKALNQYQSFVTKLRSNSPPVSVDWTHYLVIMQCNAGRSYSRCSNVRACVFLRFSLYHQSSKSLSQL